MSTTTAHSAEGATSNASPEVPSRNPVQTKLRRTEIGRPRRAIRISESYGVVSAFDQFEYCQVAPLFRRMAESFEYCVYGLNRVKSGLEALREERFKH
jgi:hypothetical protein